MTINLGFVDTQAERQYFVSCVREKRGETRLAAAYVYASSPMLACEKAERQIALERGDDLSDWFAYRVQEG